MITKDGRDTPIEKLTAENYIVPQGEAKDYHCVIEVTQYDQKTGRKISRPRVQKFGRKTFEQTVQSSLRKQGYTVTILHDPNEWLKAHKAEAARKAKAVADAKAKADQERFDAAVAAAVAKALTERENMAKALAERENKAADGETETMQYVAPDTTGKGRKTKNTEK